MSDTPDIDLRPAGPEHREAMLAACRETFEAHRDALPFMFRPEGFEEFYARYIDACFLLPEGEERDADGVAQVAYLGDELAGYIILAVSRSPGGGLEVFDIHVFAPFRGQGVGHALLDWAKARATQIQAHNLDATVWALGDDRAAFFEKAGFQPVNGLWRIGPNTAPPPREPRTGRTVRRDGILNEPNFLWMVIVVLAVLLVIA